MPNKKVSLDTNVLLDNPDIVFDSSREFVIAFMVIRELDKLKRNPDLKRAAQAAIKNIWSLYEDNKIEILDIPTNLDSSPDELIIQATLKADAMLLSNDIGARIIAKSQNVEISDFAAKETIDWSYTGYKEVVGGMSYEDKYIQLTEVQLEEFEIDLDIKLMKNEYCIVERLGDKNDIWKNIKGKVYKISQKIKPFKSAGILKYPLDDIQMCALDAVFDPVTPLTILDGSIGTGKTLIALMGALGTAVNQTTEKRYQFYDKILVTKPPLSINKNLYTGYKKGTSEEKMNGHLGGIKTNLSFLLNKSTDKDEDDSPAAISWRNNFGIIEIDEMQGYSLHNTILIVDEYQLLEDDITKLVLSRIAENSKVVLVGDVREQTYGVNRLNEGYKRLFLHLGKADEMSFIRLENIYRSKLASFVNDIYKD